MPVPDLESVLAPEGWVYASSLPVDAADMGRFHALFGRDSLISALALLPVRPEIARATLQALAALQGRRDDPATGEEPGKIVHEHWPDAPPRFAEAGWPVRNGEMRYYGSADSTSWFLVLLAATGDERLWAELETPWRAAAGWLERALESGGGLVRHGPGEGPGGLVQQGWRDTVAGPDATGGPAGGGIVRPDGSLPAAPLADADSQAAAFAALRALFQLTRDGHWARLSADLCERIAAGFGDAETLALEPDGTPVPGAGSQLGWLLWSGALRGQARERAARRLCEPDVLTPFGLRTLCEGHPAFMLDGYHRGAVWPFDSWLGWAGLRQAGRTREAECVRVGVLDAVERLGGAPELYAVEEAGPRLVAGANRVQGWTVAARWALEAGWQGRRGELGH